MGFFDSGTAKSRARQRTSMIEEAAAAGCQVLEIVDSADAATATSVVAGTLKVLVGGRVTTDFHQVVVLRTGPLTHAYVQPYQGIQPQPGEHHAIREKVRQRKIRQVEHQQRENRRGAFHRIEEVSDRDAVGAAID